MHAPIPFISQVSEQEQQDWIERLSNLLPGEQFSALSELTEEEKHSAELAVVANPRPEDVAQLPNLKWIHSVWAGVERMVKDLEDTTFEIVRLVDPELARTMAEAVLAWTMYVHRDMPQYAKLQQEKCWKELPYTRAADRKVGVMGLGELGHASAEILVSTGFDVLGWSRSAKEIEGVQCFSGDDGLTDMIAQSDILVCLLPLTDKTRGLLGKDQLGALPAKAAIINFARGPIVDTPALLSALDSGAISHAVLDVFDVEPLPEESPFWSHADVTVLPHISAPTNTATAAGIVANNIRNYREGGVLPQTVDRGRGY